MLISCKDLKAKPHNAVLALIFILLLMSAWLLKDLIQNYFTQDSLMQSNLIYLQQIRSQTTKDFIALSGVYGLLEAVKSSTLGIDFIVKAQVTAGKELETLAQLSLQGMEYAALAAASSQLYQELLLLSQRIMPYCLIVLLFCIACYFLFNALNMSNTARHQLSLLKAVLTIFLFVHLALPYSVHLAALSHTPEHHQKASDHFEAIHKEYQQHARSHSTKDRAHNLVHMAEALVIKIEHRIEALLKYVLQYTIHIILTFYLIPGLTLCLTGYLFYCSVQKFFPLPLKSDG